MEKKNEIIETNVNNSPAEMIRLAVSGKADLDKLKQLLDLQERFEANEAKKAYHKAMSDFKANPPKINKDKTVGYEAKTGGKVGYKHASLANVTEKINSELSKYGLSASWSTKQNGTISVTCKITHVQGHSEETTLSASADATGSKNAIQAIGSTITYLERYTLLALTGLATFEDDDGKASDTDYINDKQKSSILDMLATLSDTVSGREEAYKRFLVYMKVEKIDEIPAKDYQKAIRAIETTKRTQEELKKKKRVQSENYKL